MPEGAAVPGGLCHLQQDQAKKASRKGIEKSITKRVIDKKKKWGFEESMDGTCRSYVKCVVWSHQFQPSEFSAATGAEMKAVRPELFMSLLRLPWLLRVLPGMPPTPP